MSNKATEKIQQRNRDSLAVSKMRKERKEKRETQAELKVANTLIKKQDDLISAQISEINRLEKLIEAREEQESLIICKNDKGAITNIVYTQAYNERVPLQTMEGIDLLKITKSRAYAKFPFLYEENGIIGINKKQHNKYLIVGGLI
jgi:hypothetical protein